MIQDPPNVDVSTLRSTFDSRPRDLDPNYDWIEITTLDDVGPRYVPGRCRHLDPLPVLSVVTGEELARLCTVCDMQLPPTRENMR